LALTALVIAAAACGRPATAHDVTVEWSLVPESPAVDRPAEARVIVRDAAGQPVRSAALDIEAHMEHPGMAPVIARTAEQAPGVYGARLSLSMAGGWVAFVTGTLPDGQRVRQRAASFVVGPAD
jgi:hypothetical protein